MDCVVSVSQQFLQSGLVDDRDNRIIQHPRIGVVRSKLDEGAKASLRWDERHTEYSERRVYALECIYCYGLLDRTVRRALWAGLSGVSHRGIFLK